MHSWDLSTGVDGPGIRFVTFLSGCPLTCLYCHNPGTWRVRSSKRTSADDVVAAAAEYTRFSAAARGGATVSGGEPLLQPVITDELPHRFKDELRLHPALDTSGFLGVGAADALLHDVDLVLLDIKSRDRETYDKVTRRPLQLTRDFAQRPADLRKEVHVRFVLVPGLTDDPADAGGVTAFAGLLGNMWLGHVSRVDGLPFHKLGQGKRQALGMNFTLHDTPSSSADQVAVGKIVFEAEGLKAV